MSGFVQDVAFSSNRMDWETPVALFNSLNDEFHFTLDAASSDDNAKCSNHFTVKQDGLKQDWGGQTVFCNPPYCRQLPKWVHKAAAEALKPGTTVVLLIPARTDTRWFHDCLYRRAQIRFIKGRLKFAINGHPGDAAPFPSMICVLGGM